MYPLHMFVDVQCSYPLNLRRCCIVWNSVLTAVYMLLAHGQCLSLTSLFLPPQFSHTYHFSFFLMYDILPCMIIPSTSTLFVFHCMYDLHTHMCIDSYMYRHMYTVYMCIRHMYTDLTLLLFSFTKYTSSLQP